MDTTHILNHPETLKYFFSSIFQGFAALLALGAMFYLYFFERIEREQDSIIKKLEIEFERKKTSLEYDTTFFMDTWVASKGVYSLAKKIVGEFKNDPMYMAMNTLINRYEDTLRREKNFRKGIPILVGLNFIILIASLTALFNVDYSHSNNSQAYYFALILLFICIIYFGYLQFIMLRIIKKQY